MEALARRMFRGPDMPQGWHLNTCLVNFYGSRLEDGRWVDTARVGEHKDFEPGPVASLSLGERALHPVRHVHAARASATRWCCEQWLDDGSLQLFGGRAVEGADVPPGAAGGHARGPRDCRRSCRTSGRGASTSRSATCRTRT